MKNNLDERSGDLTDKICKIDGIIVIEPDGLNKDKFCFASQTTMLYNDTRIVEKSLKECFKARNTKLTCCMTICRATYRQQQAAIQLCETKPDLIFVIGGYDSSNTTHLYQLASQYSKTFYISDDESIERQKLKYFVPNIKSEEVIPTAEVFEKVKTIAILAGASCPFYIVNNVIEKLKQY